MDQATKNPENNSSHLSQATNRTSREYVFDPVRSHVKITILICMLFFGVYGLIANSLILYSKQKKRRRRRNRLQARPLTEYFVQSLCLTDILCSLITLPLYSTEMFVDYVTRDWICKFTRFLLTIFPVVTAQNLLVIGVERYLAIFHPFFSLSRKIAKAMVAGAWVFGVLLSTKAAVWVRLVDHELGDGFYTKFCKYDSSVKLGRNVFASFFFISYLIPSLILTFINLRILKRQRSSQRIDASRTTQRAIARMKVTRMFTSLIFAFILPYMTFFAYSSFRTASNNDVSFTDDYIVRRVSVLLANANGSVSASILIYYEKIYIDFLAFFRSRSTEGNQANEVFQRRAPVPNENERQPNEESPI